MVEVQYIVPQIEPEEGAVGKVLHKKSTLESPKQSKWLKIQAHNLETILIPVSHYHAARLLLCFAKSYNIC